MEVVKPSSPIMDFDHLNYLSAPSSPRRFGQCFSSAPASPNSISEFYHKFDDLSIQSRGVHDPVISTGDEYDLDFAFDVSVVSEKASRSADELFSGGKIRPLKPELEEMAVKPVIASPKSPIVQGKSFLRNVFSPRRKKQREGCSSVAAEKKKTEENRGNGDCWGQTPTKAVLTCSSSTSSSKGSSKRWSLKNLMLFRSASEGRGSDKDHLRKYAPQPQPQPMLRKNEQVNSASFRSGSNGSFRSGEGSRRKMSAHEVHYAANRAASEDQKKRTFLPYNQGILAFSSVHGFGSLAR